MSRQPSFGGVAQLFGDDTFDSAPAAPSGNAKSSRQASFGGVASLFGDDDDDMGYSAPAKTSAPAAGRRAPSFGGVANLFGSADDDAAPPPAKSGGRVGRQASFGGVAALFGDEDEDEAPPAQINTKVKKQGARQASFGGVAALFGQEDDGAGVGAPPPSVTSSAPPAKPGSKKRDPSFSGVANLFGSDSEEEEEPAAPAKSSETIAPLKDHGPSKPRTKKRDPSFGGVANLFADENDDESEEEGVLTNFTLKPNVSSKVTTDLQIQVEEQREKVTELEADLKAVEDRNRGLEEKIARLQAEHKELVNSKLTLIKLTCSEIDRMRSVMTEMQSTPSERKTAATVS